MAEREFRVGDRVEINYGPGTVINVWPDMSGRGRPPLIVVHADVGQAWFRDLADVRLLGTGPEPDIGFKAGADG